MNAAMMKILINVIAIASLEIGGGQNANAADAGCAPVIEAFTKQSKAARYSVRSEVATQAGTTITETILTPEGMYLKLDGKWTRNPIKVTPQDRAKEVEFAANTISDCKRLGKESLAGAPTLMYEYKQELVEGQAGESKLWVGTADGLPRKLETRSSAGSVTLLLRYGADLNLPAK